MNRPDYDFTKHIEVPEAWIEKALAVPSSCKEKTRISPFRCLIAAASVVLALGLSISLYFLFRNISAPVAVAPSPSSGDSRTPASVQEATFTPEPTPVPSPVTVPVVAPTQNGLKPEPTDTPTQPATDVPAAHTAEAPTEKPAPTPTEQPIIQPAQPEATHPVERPSYEVHDVEIIDLLYTDSPDPIFTAENDDSAEYYCCLYDSTGQQLGDPDLYAESHRAELTVAINGQYLHYAAAVCVPSVSGSEPDSDSDFTYRFYDRYGRVWAEGTVCL